MTNLNDLAHNHIFPTSADVRAAHCSTATTAYVMPSARKTESCCSVVRLQYTDDSNYVALAVFNFWVYILTMRTNENKYLISIHLL